MKDWRSLLLAVCVFSLLSGGVYAKDWRPSPVFLPLVQRGEVADSTATVTPTPTATATACVAPSDRWERIELEGSCGFRLLENQNQVLRLPVGWHVDDVNGRTDGPVELIVSWPSSLWRDEDTAESVQVLPDPTATATMTPTATATMTPTATATMTPTATVDVYYEKFQVGYGDQSGSRGCWLRFDVVGGTDVFVRVEVFNLGDAAPANTHEEVVIDQQVDFDINCYHVERVEIVLDPENVIVESNENNNEGSELVGEIYACTNPNTPSEDRWTRILNNDGFVRGCGWILTPGDGFVINIPEDWELNATGGKFSAEDYHVQQDEVVSMWRIYP